MVQQGYIPEDNDIKFLVIASPYKAVVPVIYRESQHVDQVSSGVVSPKTTLKVP